MELLHSQKLQNSMVQKKSIQNGKGYLSFPFINKRILILSDSIEEASLIAKKLNKNNCRIALVTSADRNEGMSGMRIIPSKSNLMKEIGNLMDSWKGVDILINFTHPTFDIIHAYIIQYLSVKPSPASYKRRIIEIANKDANSNPQEESIIYRKEASGSSFAHFEIAKPSGYNAREMLIKLIMLALLPETTSIQTI